MRGKSRSPVKREVREIRAWAARWYSRNRLDGVSTHFLFHEPRRPALFRTRREAREWIRAEYGYIAERPDLQREPHGWRVPTAVRVRVRIEAIR